MYRQPSRQFFTNVEIKSKTNILQTPWLTGSPHGVITPHFPTSGNSGSVGRCVDDCVRVRVERVDVVVDRVLRVLLVLLVVESVVDIVSELDFVVVVPVVGTVIGSVVVLSHIGCSQSAQPSGHFDPHGQA